MTHERTTFDDLIDAQATIDRLSADAARYRWLRREAADILCHIAWRTRAACAFDSAQVDQCIDAARAEKP